MTVILIVIIIVVIAAVAINYTTMARSYQDNERTLRNMTEAYISSSFHRIDTGLKMYDNTFNDQMREKSGLVMDAYNRSGGDPSSIDLAALSKESGMSIYFINPSGVVEYSSVSRDIGLDFSVIYPDFYRYLKEIWYAPGFYPDRVVTEWVEGALTKFAYMPTPDHRYVIEIGLASPKFGTDRKGLKYGDVRREAEDFNPYIEEMRIWQKQKRVVGNSSYQPSQEQSGTLDILLRDRTSLEHQGPGPGRSSKWFFVDMKDPVYAADMSLIVEIVYNEAKISGDLNWLLMVHSLVALVALGFGGLVAFTLSRRLARPIQGIVDDVDIIARGDLEHTIAPPGTWEFESMGRSINAMVEKLKSTIDQLQKSQADLKQSEERYRNVVETQTEMIARFRPDGTHVFVNDAYCAYFGLPCNRIIGTKWKPFIPEADRNRLSRHFANLSPGSPQGTIEHRIVLPSGEVRWQQWNDKALFNDAGRIVEYQSVGRDITGMKCIEDALRRSEEDYRTLVQSANSIILRFTPDGILTFINQFGQDFFGYSWDEIYGRNIIGTIVPEWDSKGTNLREKILDLSIHPDLYRIAENENITKFGRRVWIAWTNKPLYDTKGRVMEILSIGNDITLLKTVEDELRRLNEVLEQRVVERTRDLAEANRELEAFSYSVSHDLRAPLRAIDGFAAMLLTGYGDRIPPEGREYLERIRQNIQVMSQLINAILNFSRMSRQPLDTQRVYPMQLVKEALTELSDPQQGRSIEIVTGELPPIEGDPALLRQVYVNLLSNAIKFTREKEKARIEIGSLQSHGRTLFFVKDNGVGFDMRYVDKIFGVFQRLHNPAEYEGTGIGLAIAQRIIERHGGKIWVDSKMGEGTTFYFTIGPVREEEHAGS
jgi:PAS domain S-box-containing protein